MNISRRFEDNKIFWCVCLGLICVAARFAVGAFSLSYIDFRNEIFTGELAASGRNVYAEQRYYNYGPVFFILLGWLHRIAFSFSQGVLAYKFLLVCVFTLADFLTARLISRKSGTLWGLVFFLNPISFITCSYLSQFDGIAVMFAAYGVSFLEESSHRENFTADDLLGTLLLSLSLMTKHIMWAFPVWLLLNRNIHPRKKALYAFVPVVMFLVSFAPYWSGGSQGIISNVFLYRSRNNLPLLGLDILHRAVNNLPLFGCGADPYGASELFLHRHAFSVYALLIFGAGYVFRRESICNNFLLYTISMVCFASAISTQYLSIPCMALVVLFRKKALIYFPLIGTALLGMHIMKIVMVWTLLGYLIEYYRHHRTLC